MRVESAFMDRALALARRGIGFTSPNPCVGAVLVRSGRIVGEGWHHCAGTPHAEVNAIEDARQKRERVKGSTLYVTLEPCCSHGRTPPCTDLIVRSGVRRVVVAATDPNPKHAGKAYPILRAAGIEVVINVGVLEAEKLNRSFNRWITQRIPWVIGKLALSLDGRIAGRAGDSQWITSLPARRYAHQLRGESDAIIIGASTARNDDPSLNIRLSAYRKKLQPWRVVVTRSGRLPSSLKLFTDTYRERTLVFQDQPLREVLDGLGARGVTCALIEGGGLLLGQAFSERLVDEVVFFLAPTVLGSPNRGVVIGKTGIPLQLQDPKYFRLGPDLVCRSLVGPATA